MIFSAWFIREKLIQKY